MQIVVCLSVIILTLIFLCYMCYIYQRNFILCDKLLFENCESIRFKLNKGIQYTEKLMCDKRIIIDEGFIRDDNMECSIRYYVMYKYENKSTILYCHGNRGSIDRHLIKAFTFLNELNCNVVLFDYAGYGVSESMCRSKYDIFSNTVSVYEKVILQNSYLSSTSLIIYGISLGAIPAYMITMHITHNKESNQPKLILENGLYSVRYMFQNTQKWSFLRHFPMNNDFDMFSKFDNELFHISDNGIKLSILLISCLHDPVISYKHTIKIYENLLKHDTSYVRFDDPDFGHINSWKFGSIYFTPIRTFLSEVQSG